CIVEMQPLLFKDSANRTQYKTNLFDFVLLRCSLSYLKIVQIEHNAKQTCLILHFLDAACLI
ncbi:hypothetical protein, partial [Prevotella sp.]|uniref:hypothetical protein n=1 Tax=Prevotella sp. TaxID=59823 RepID=UPI003F7F46C9